MILLAAFAAGVLAAITVTFISDRRAIRREQTFWEGLRADALAGYGRVFDWERDL